MLDAIMAQHPLWMWGEIVGVLLVVLAIVWMKSDRFQRWLLEKSLTFGWSVIQSIAVVATGVTGALVLFLIGQEFHEGWLAVPGTTILIAALMTAMRQHAQHLRAEEAASKSKKTLNMQADTMNQLRALTRQPSQEFLTSAAELFSSSLETVLIVVEGWHRNADEVQRNDVAEPLARLIENVARLTAYFHNEKPAMTRFTGNLMLPQRISEMDTATKTGVDDELRFHANTESVESFEYVLRMFDDLIVTTRRVAAPYGADFALPVPKETGREGESLLLPGASWAFKMHEDGGNIFDLSKSEVWFSTNSGLSSPVQREVLDYFKQAPFSSFVSFPISGSGQDEPIAVLNIDGYKGLVLFDDTPPIEQFRAVISPFLDLMAVLVPMYQSIVMEG